MTEELTYTIRINGVMLVENVEEFVGGRLWLHLVDTSGEALAVPRSGIETLEKSVNGGNFNPVKLKGFK